jgi:hypothetical protein
MTNRLKYLLSTFGFLVVGLLFHHGGSISISEQMPLYEGIRNTAAIIFGVMGAWLAILHPESLKSIFSSTETTIKKEDTKTIEILLRPIIVSTAILIVVLSFTFLIPLFKTYSFLVPYRETLRGISFAVLGVLTALQIYTLVMSLAPIDWIHRNIFNSQTRSRLLAGKFSRTKKVSKSK